MELRFTATGDSVFVSNTFSQAEQEWQDTKAIAVLERAHMGLLQVIVFQLAASSAAPTSQASAAFNMHGNPHQSFSPRLQAARERVEFIRSFGEVPSDLSESKTSATIKPTPTLKDEKTVASKSSRRIGSALVPLHSLRVEHQQQAHVDAGHDTDGAGPAAGDASNTNKFAGGERRWVQLEEQGTGVGRVLLWVRRASLLPDMPAAEDAAADAAGKGYSRTRRHVALLAERDQEAAFREYAELAEERRTAKVEARLCRDVARKREEEALAFVQQVSRGRVQALAKVPPTLRCSRDVLFGGCLGMRDVATLLAAREAERVALEKDAVGEEEQDVGCAQESDGGHDGRIEEDLECSQNGSGARPESEHLQGQLESEVSLTFAENRSMPELLAVMQRFQSHAGAQVVHGDCVPVLFASSSAHLYCSVYCTFPCQTCLSHLSTLLTVL